MPLVTRDSTQANVFRQSTTPTGTTGDIWVDTSTSPPTEKIYSGTAWNPTGANKAELIAFG